MPSCFGSLLSVGVGLERAPFGRRWALMRGDDVEIVRSGFVRGQQRPIRAATTQPTPQVPRLLGLVAQNLRGT